MDDTHQLSLTLTPAPEAIMTVRPGTLDDLDVLVSLGLAAMPMDPQWDYRYPHRAEYPQEHRECTAQRWERFFHPDPSGGEWAVYLVDYLPQDRDADSDNNNNNNNNSPETETERETEKEMDTGRELEPVTISFSVWHFPHHLHNVLGREQRNEKFILTETLACKNRHDWDPRHMQAWREAIRAAARDKFDARYGQQQAHLQILGTHPQYQRMGAASSLLRWGIREAGHHGLPVTLFASSMGRPLYRSFGFEERGAVKVHVEGEEESVVVEAMALELTKD
ncbi:hypothetical protein BKA56DRAFT_596028 [Ilyonectria sp. MPI-CAGE-AT-0026]|nr:hypothetical protein BKA56DRAFT_596028 [Ilyonectria sp. MPI-CAGE-AT-0026]